MQKSAQEPAQNSIRTRPVFWRVDAMGMPHSEAVLAEGGSEADGDFLAAISCALYSHAMSMAKAFDLGTLQAIECHLSDGTVVMHRANTCGDLHIIETTGSLNPPN